MKLISRRYFIFLSGWLTFFKKSNVRCFRSIGMKFGRIVARLNDTDRQQSNSCCSMLSSGPTHGNHRGRSSENSRGDFFNHRENSRVDIKFWGRSHSLSDQNSRGNSCLNEHCHSDRNHSGHSEWGHCIRHTPTVQNCVIIFTHRVAWVGERESRREGRESPTKTRRWFSYMHEVWGGRLNYRVPV